MEDDNGLELSLGLSFGGTSGKSKIKDGSDPKVDDGSCTRLMDGNMTVADTSFKNFLQAGTENQDQKGKQKTSSETQPQENFFTDLGKCSNPVIDHSNNVHNSLSQFNRYQELWASNNKTAETEGEKSNKRKMPFEEIDFQNKHDKVADYSDTYGKNPVSVNMMRNSHVSVTTEDACSAVNEDVAESEAEGSNSWLISQNEEKSKSSDIPKISDKCAAGDSNGIALHGQKEAAVSGRFSSASAIQPLPVSNGERPPVPVMNTSSLQLSFGYSPVQLPTLETGSSWAFNSQPQHLSSLISRDGATNMENSDGLKASHVSLQVPRNSSAGVTSEDKSLDLVKGGNHTGEISSSSQNEDQSKGPIAFLRQKEKSNMSATVGASHEGTMIRPGIASDVKFGGCGSYPDLPWVSTTGPNGRTVSGVTYKYNQNEIRIVCACHGIHMTPEKFVQHASADTPNPENNAVPGPFPSSNPAASAKS